MPDFYQSVLGLFEPTRLMLFGMVLARTSGLVMIGPVYGSRDVPVHARAMFAVTLAFLILPTQWHAQAPTPQTLLDFLTYVGAEVAVGYALSLGIWIVFSALQIAGQVIGQTAGMSLADVFNPGVDTNMPLASLFLQLFGVAVWLLIGGHRLAVEGFLETFSAVPPGSVLDFAVISDTLSNLAAGSFELGLRVAGPVVAALLLASLVLGLISRTIPQLNILAFGFSINAMVFFGMFSMSLGVIGYVFQEEILAAADVMLRGLSNAATPASG